MKRMILCAAVLVTAAVAAVAQSASAWAEVEYSVGDDIVVIRAGHPVPVDDLIGFRLAEGDQIQTGKGTFVELRLMPSGGMIKISENTAFVLSRIASAKDRSFKLLYGRVRAKVDKLASADSFDVRGDVATAGVRGTDFGYEALTSKATGTESQKPVTRVYCFDGSVVVAVAPSYEGQDVKPIVVKPGKMVQVEEKDGFWVPELLPLPEEVKSFWSTNEFAEPGALKIGTAPKAEGAPDPAASIGLPSYASVQAGMKVKNGAILGGIILVGLGSIMQGVGAYAYSSGDPVLGLNGVAGGAFLGILALPVLVFGLSSNPVLVEP
jgi:hypothetical protein